MRSCRTCAPENLSQTMDPPTKGMQIFEWNNYIMCIVHTRNKVRELLFLSHIQPCLTVHHSAGLGSFPKISLLAFGCLNPAIFAVTPACPYASTHDTNIAVCSSNLPTFRSRNQSLHDSIDTSCGRNDSNFKQTQVISFIEHHSQIFLNTRLPLNKE